MGKSNESTDPKPQPTPVDRPAEQPAVLLAQEGESASAASGLRDEDRTGVPSEAVVAATDEFFKQHPVLSLEPQGVQDVPTPPSLAEAGRVPRAEEDATARPYRGRCRIRISVRVSSQIQQTKSLKKDLLIQFSRRTADAGPAFTGGDGTASRKRVPKLSSSTASG